MTKTLIVREFDKIVSNNFPPTNKYHCLDKLHFNMLKEYISYVTIDESISNYFEYKYTKFGETITIRNYVGLIELKDGFQIQILPKIDLSLASANVDEQSVLLDMISTVLSPLFKEQGTAATNTSKTNIFEYLIHVFIKHIDILIKKGLKSEYTTVEENTKVFKGKLLTIQNIYRNFNHRERFFVQHDKYEMNCPENRILKSTLLLLQMKSSSYQNKKLLRQQLFYFETVPKSSNITADFDKIIFSRNNKSYEVPLKWAQIFLNKSSFTIFSGEVSVNSFLFRMDRLYEDFVAEVVRKFTISGKWIFKAQDRRYTLFDFPKRFTLKPDIVLEDKYSGAKVVIDTKWKHLNLNSAKNYGISRNDMYQMYAYSKKYKASEIYLLFPYVSKASSHIFKSNDNVNVHVKFVDMTNSRRELQRIITELENDTK